MGGVGANVGRALAVTPGGDIVLAGFTHSPIDIATAGAHQEMPGGNSDAFVAVFSSAGSRLWGTYYGGRSRDEGLALAVTPGGDIVLAGQTESPTAIATAGVHQENGSGSSDAYVAVFTSTGTRLWATYYGGSGQDYGTALAVTTGGDIVLAGCTRSPDAIATAGAHQGTYRGGIADAFVVVFSSTGTRRWGTYYGGSGQDEATALAVTPGGDIVMAGLTTSENAIATAGAHQATYGGGTADAFVVVFSSTGTRRWGSYYGGSDRDWITALAVTPGGDIVMAGTAVSPAAIATAGAHQATNGGGLWDAFVAVFTSTGTRLWGTYYGGGSADYGNALAVTSEGNIVLAGRTESNNAIATARAHQTNRRWFRDAFVAAFTSTGSRLWGTYYGGSGHDEGYALAATPGGDIVLAGLTTSEDSIATAGAHQVMYGGGNWDAFVAVFRQDTATSIVIDEPVPVPHTHTIAAICPNPASGHTVVTTSATTDAVLSIVDVLGRVHVRQPVTAGSTATTISTSGLPSGSYYLRLEPNAGTGNVRAHTQALIVVQ